MKQVAVSLFAVLALSILAGPNVHAQAPISAARVGVLGVGPHPDGGPLVGVLKEALGGDGWIESQNVEYDVAVAGTFGGLGQPAAGPGRRKVSVIVTMGLDEVTLVARRATSTVPIVMVLGVNPERAGLIAGLQRPGGNVTGILSDVSPEIWGKLLELLKEAFPALRRIAAVWNPTVYGSAEEYWRMGTESARRLGLVLEPAPVRVPGDMEAVLTRIHAMRADAFYVPGDPVTFFQRKRVIEFARTQRIPVMYPTRTFVDEGGLTSYGPNLIGIVRHAARYVDRILRGANPAELPVERPTKLELVVNQTTARALGLRIPQSIAIRADEIIQ